MHLDRAALQPCDRCGNFSCGECLAPSGSQQLCAACRARWAELEWDRRQDLGLFRAWWLTTRRMIVSPIQTLDAIAPDGQILESTIYAGLSTLAGFVPTLFAYGAIIGLMLAIGPNAKDTTVGLAAGTGIGAAAIFFYVLLLLAMSIGGMLLSAALELIVLRLGGKPQASYSVSVRAHALSMAAYAIGVIPLCSIYVFPVWALVLRVFAIPTAYRPPPTPQHSSSGINAEATPSPAVVRCSL